MADPRVVFDPVAAFLRRPLHEVLSVERLPAPTPPPRAQHSLQGLCQLAAEYRWAAVLELATTLLAADEDKHTLNSHDRLICIALRARALVQTGQIAAAAHAVAELGDLKTLHYRRDSHGEDHRIVPFELQLLAVEVRIRQGDATAIADTYELRRQVIANQSLTEEESRAREAVLLSCLASYHLVAQHHDAAADVARELMVRLGGGAHAVYMYIRVLIHIGDFEGAAHTLRVASRRKGDSDAMRHLHSGMLQAARGRYHEALLEYDSALEAQKKELPPQVSPSNLWAHAMNNAAVCLMHCGRLAEAIDRLESALRRDPEVALDEGVTFNLAVMYDLAYPQNSQEKKQVLRDLASRFGRQGFDLQKIPMMEKEKS